MKIGQNKILVDKNTYDPRMAVDFISIASPCCCPQQKHTLFAALGFALHM